MSTDRSSPTSRDRVPGAREVRDAGLTPMLAVLDGAPTSVVVVDGEGRVTHANQRALDSFGYTAEELVGRSAEILVPEEDVAGRLVDRAAYLRAPRPADTGGTHRWRARRRDGSSFPVEVRLVPLSIPGGPRVMASITDMSRAREAEQRLHDLNRLYLTLARLNQATVRARSAEELYAETCRIAVEEGGYLGAWFARPGPGAGIERLASAGALDGYIARLRPTMDPTSPRGHGPMARALRGNTPYYSDDFANDEATRPWQELAATFGVRAAAALPICCGGQVVAVFALWSERVHVFDDQARTLLESLARNVSFALDGFDAEQRLERAVVQRSDLLHRLVAAQEDERTRIAAAVHDDSVQALASVDLRLGLLARRVRETAPELSPAVTQLQATVEAVSSGLRRLLVELEPVGEDVPLVDMLREAAGHVFENDDVHWSVVRDPGAGSDSWPDAGPDAGPDGGLAGPVLGLAVRITREVLVDVRDRTDAGSVVVTVRPAEDGVLLTVVDDGRSPGDPADDLVLRRVRDRAEIAGGWCRVETRGTAAGLQCWLPRDVPGEPPG